MLKCIDKKKHIQVSNFAYIEYEVSIVQIIKCLRCGNKCKINIS